MLMLNCFNKLHGELPVILENISVPIVASTSGGDGGSPRPAPPNQTRPVPTTDKSFTGTRAICNPGSRDPKRRERSRHVERGGWRVGTDRQSPASTLYCPAVNHPTTARRWPRHTLNSHLGCNHSPAVTHLGWRAILGRLSCVCHHSTVARGPAWPGVPSCALATQRPAFESSG